MKCTDLPKNSNPNIHSAAITVIHKQGHKLCIPAAVSLKKDTLDKYPTLLDTPKVFIRLFISITIGIYER